MEYSNRDCRLSFRWNDDDRRTRTGRRESVLRGSKHMNNTPIVVVNTNLVVVFVVVVVVVMPKEAILRFLLCFIIVTKRCCLFFRCDDTDLGDCHLSQKLLAAR